MANNSLSSVVSSLVRAQMGTSLAPTVTDEDLDRHVAELILKEAKKKAERYGQQGIRALISNNVDSNAPRPNKRFLTSIIKSTDEHNKTILRAQAQAAEEVKQQRAEQEKRERRRRAQEAVEAEQLRRSAGRSNASSKRRRTNEDEGWDRWDGRTAERSRKTRDWATWNGDNGEDYSEDEDGTHSKSRKRRRESPSRSRSRSRDRDRDNRRRSSRRTRDEEEASSRKRRRDRDRSRSPRGKHVSTRDRSRDGHRRRGSHSPSTSSRTARSESPKRKSRREPTKYALDDHLDNPLSTRKSPSPALPSSSRHSHKDTGHDRQTTSKSERKSRDKLHSSSRTSPERGSSSKRRGRSRSPSSSASSSHSRQMSISSRSSTPGPHPPVQLPSKMDKYFEESYDPRFDVAPLSIPTVPKTGLINDAEYVGWDAMLEFLRLRRQDKEDKKALERLGLPTKDKKKPVPSSSADVAARWGGETASIMDIEYTKRGAVREWDVGKAGF